MNINNLPLLPPIVNRAKDAARAVKEGVHQKVESVTETTLTRLLDLRHFAVEGYALERQAQQDVLHLFCRLTIAVAVCPSCQAVSTTIKQYKERCVRDCDTLGKRTFVHFKSRRFECSACGCRFTEELQAVDWRRRQTRRFEHLVYQRCLHSSKKAVASQLHLSQCTVHGIFKRQAKQRTRQHTHLVRILGIDEIALKKRHKQYALVLSDLERKVVLAVLPSREQAELEKWFNTLSPVQRRAIRVVSMDMWRPYRTCVKQHLPRATIVADRFHVMKQLNEQLTKVRRRIQQQADAKTQEALKGSRWLLLRTPETLTAKQKAQLQQALAADDQLRTAYLLKEEFRLIFEHIDDRHKAERFLKAWICKVQLTKNRFLLDFVKTLRNWWQEILNYFIERITNGFVEGMNRAIRTIIWQAYGYRNFENFKRQVLAQHGFT